MMEDINGRSSVFGTLHCGTAPGGPCNENTGIGSGERACSGCQTGYHTYAVQIDRSVSPEQIRWYLDGTNYFTVNSSQVDATTWANAIDHKLPDHLRPRHRRRLPGRVRRRVPNASTVSGGQLNVDYVAVYNKPPATNYGANIAPQQADHLVVRGRAPRSRLRTRPTATSPPAGRARSATRSGSRWTSASRTTSTTCD